MPLTEVLAADIGGTHARFAIATRAADGRILLGHEAKLKVADFASLETAVQSYRGRLGRAAPARAAIAVACPIEGDLLKLTNNPWAIRPATAAAQLGLDEALFINDFAAVAHAVSVCPPDMFEHLAGPDAPLPAEGAVSVVGPGTGLGVALLLTGRHPRVVATEGGHIDYAPLDSLEDRILHHLRERYRRVSVERLVSGPGLVNIHAALASIEGRAVPPPRRHRALGSGADGRRRAGKNGVRSLVSGAGQRHRRSGACACGAGRGAGRRDAAARQASAGGFRFSRPLRCQGAV